MTRSSELERHLADQAGSEERFGAFFWHRLRSDYALDVISRFAPASPVIVDIGAGAGIFGTHFSRKFPGGAYGFIEPIPAQAERLRRRYSAEADWSRRSLRDADGLVLLDVLEHQEDDLAFLADLREGMKPGAFLLITGPALSWLWSDWDEKMGHYRRYSLAALRTVAAQAGFEIAESRYLFPALVLPGIFRKFRGPRPAEFPPVASAVNSLLLRLGKIGLAAGKWIPFGSSVAIVCRRKI
jgi:hypothetical protein